MKTFTFEKNVPKENHCLRDSIYNGQVYLADPVYASRKLVRDVLELMKERFQLDDVRMAHEYLSDEELFKHVGRLRRQLYLENAFHEVVSEILVAYGFHLEEVAFDPIRLRVVLPDGHHNPKAAPVYYPHRDTWYGHPQGLIVFWIPLDNLEPEETFVFYPEYFDREVANDSEIFNYDDWVRDGPDLKIGWQKEDTGLTARYPNSQEKQEPECKVGFSCRRGECLIFSGAHYHRTLPLVSRRTRFSLDFRVAHLPDVEAGKGAPNVDNRSRGSSVKDYVRFGWKV